MPQTPWRPKIEVIVNGETVSAEVANRPIRQLADQTQHLKERVNALDPKSGQVVYTSAPLDDSVLKGDIVYFDEQDEVYKPAIAEAIGGSNGEYFASPRAFAVGMVVNKSSSTIGDIVQLGRIKLSDYALAASDLLDNPLHDPFESGRYYLSSKVPGKITRHIVAPSIQIGFFTESECQIFPLQKDIFDSHRHYSFPLLAKPSASQNFDRTGWTSFGEVDSSAKKWVDYFNRDVDAEPPAIVLCLRGTGAATVDAPVRVEFFRDGDDKLGLEYIDDPDYDDSTSGTYPGDLSQLEWPDYGEWVAIPNTNLEVAFIRRDADYTNPLATDILTLLVDDTYRFRVYLPDDLTGWTNANPFDLGVPTGVQFRYLTESDSALNNVFPPVPSESAEISNNGTTLVPNIDFKVSTLGIYWIPAGFTLDYTYAPWPHDYSTDPLDTPDPDLGKNLRINFSRSGLGAGNSVVTSLIGISPIKVTECPTGKDASTGALQIAIDLALGVSTAEPKTSDTTLVSVNGVLFDVGYHVSELEQGPGIKIDRLSSTLSKNVGKLRISRNDMKFEGEVSSIALRNAKQAVFDTYSSIEFLPPSQAATGITASFKLPNEDILLSAIKIKLLARVVGSLSLGVAAAPQNAIFKVVYHVLRPDFIASQLNDATAIAVQYWNMTFPTGYTATKVLSPEQPFDAGDADLYQIDADTLVANPNSLVALSGGFQAGDIVSVQIDRVKQSAGAENDTYSGKVGLVGLRWIMP